MTDLSGLPDQNRTDIIRYNILFSGHMIDKADRAKPRFPARYEHRAAEAIHEAIMQIANHYPGVPMTGMASGACGGDILFHEACHQEGIGSILYLPKQDEEFIEGSVRFAGVSWVERFRRTRELANEVHYLEKEKMNVVAGVENNSVYELTNLWMLQEAMSGGGSHASLVVLWDGIPGDGRGGTDQMVRIARTNGMSVKILDTNQLFQG